MSGLLIPRNLRADHVLRVQMRAEGGRFGSNSIWVRYKCLGLPLEIIQFEIPPVIYVNHPSFSGSFPLYRNKRKIMKSSVSACI